MSVKEVTCYQVVCDGCDTEHESEYSVWVDDGAAHEDAAGYDWLTEVGPARLDFCLDCRPGTAITDEQDECQHAGVDPVRPKLWCCSTCQLQFGSPLPFETIHTTHGRIWQNEYGDWVALGHLSENQFFHAFNQANRQMGTGVQMTEAPHSIVQRWAVVAGPEEGGGDEWTINYPISNTSQTAGAFRVTVLP